MYAAFQAAVTKFGAVDICVNNAGIVHETLWEKMIAVNMTAVIRGSQLALEHMRRDRGGRGGIIVNTASIAGLGPYSSIPVYAATKHAVVGFTTSWAVYVCYRPPELAQAFISMLEDQSSDDVIFEVVAGKGSYRKRQIVDPDGKSNLLTVD
nr:hypothetical protein BaRGS_023643 [Batillaria attramentaria]